LFSALEDSRKKNSPPAGARGAENAEKPKSLCGLCASAVNLKKKLRNPGKVLRREPYYRTLRWVS
jgi:hypothetical protein